MADVFSTPFYILVRFFCSFVCLLLLFHLGDNALAPKWRGVVTQVIRLLHLGETINSTKCSKANILYFYYTIPCCLFVILLVINVLLSACIDCFFLSL